MTGMHEQGDLPIPVSSTLNSRTTVKNGMKLERIRRRIRHHRRWLASKKNPRSSGRTVAAFIGEPVQGAGGVIIPPKTYWPEIQRICDKYGVLIISDEVICGFGRHMVGSAAKNHGLQTRSDYLCIGVTLRLHPAWRRIGR